MPRGARLGRATAAGLGPGDTRCPESCRESFPLASVQSATRFCGVSPDSWPRRAQGRRGAWPAGGNVWFGAQILKCVSVLVIQCSGSRQ